MIKVKKTKFRTSKKSLERLFACNRVSAEIWNACLIIAKEHHQKTGEWISKLELQKSIKRKYPLHSQSIQAVSDKYLSAREGARKAREQGFNIRYPYKEKVNFVTKWKKDGFKINQNGKIELSMGIWEGKRQIPIFVKIKEDIPVNIQEIELIWDNGLMLAISYEDDLQNEIEELRTRLGNWTKEIENNPELAQDGEIISLILKTQDMLERAIARKKENDTKKEIPKTKIAAIDMGEIHSIAAVDESGEAIIITGRQLRSIKRLRNKKFKKINKRLLHLKNGSRKQRKMLRVKMEISSKTNRQQEDILHKVSCQFTNWAEQNNIKEVVIGDVEGVERNTSAKNKNNPKYKIRRKETNQKISQWPFGLLLNYLNYKLTAIGVPLIKITEEYTSRTCPVCNRRKKVSGRVYRCHCGYSQHRDIHGALNILAKYKYGRICNTGIKIGNIKYLRPTASAVRSSRCLESGLRVNCS